MKYKYFLVLIFLSISAAYSQNNDTCSDITKRYDPFKEDSILQTKSQKLGNKLSYKFYFNKDSISMYFHFTTFTPEIIYEGEKFNISFNNDTKIQFKLDENSYPGMLGRWLTSHDFIFILNDENLKKLIQNPITEIKIADYDFSDLTGQEQFIQNLKCIMQYLK